MAKAKSRSTESAAMPSGPSAAERRKLDVEDALRTLTRAEEIKTDKSLMREVAKLAKEKASEMNTVADNLSKRGLISDKQRAKMKGKDR